MTTFLTVPMRIDALALNQQREVAGPTLGVERSPWLGRDGTDPARDHNARFANAAPAVRNNPMEPNNRFLAPGVHLHWAMPDRLTRGTTQDPGNPAFVERRGVWFPQLPNRWLVVRQDGTTVTAAWQIESDFVHPWSQGQDATAWPLQPTTNWHYPFARVGRTTQLLGVAPAPGAGRRIDSLDAPLTAVGPSDPEFAALYTACHSIFGLHDAKMLTSAVTYSVVGWYSTIKADPLSHWCSIPADQSKTKEGVAQILASAVSGMSADQITDLAAARRHAREVLFTQHTAWALPVPTKKSPTAPQSPIDCSQLLLFGTVAIDPASQVPRQTAITSTVAVGTSPREAVATLLAHNAATKDPSVVEAEFETDLEAISFGLELDDHELDHGPKLAEFRHSDGFTPSHASTLYELRPETDSHSQALDDSTKRTEKRNRDLPGEFAHRLNQLNAAHAEMDHAEQALEAQRQLVFADWQTYIQSVYPADDHADFGIDVDVLRDVVLARSLAELDQAQDRHLQHQATVAVRVAALEVQVDTFNLTSAPSDRLELVPTAGPRFWQPSDPSVAIDHADALIQSTRHGADHRARDDGKLECLVKEVDLPAFDASASQLKVFLTGLKKGMTKPFKTIADTTQSGDSWNALFVEWQSRIRPVMTDSNQRAAEGAFAPTVITTNFELGETACDLAPTVKTHYGDVGHPRQISGRSLLSYHGPEVILASAERYLDGLQSEIERTNDRQTAIIAEIADLKKQLTTLSTADMVTATKRRINDLSIEDNAIAADKAHLQRLTSTYAPLRTELAARTAVASTNTIVTFSLGGFIDRLLMRRMEQQLPVADPIGFEQDKQVAAAVATATQPARRLYTSEINAPYLPLGICDFHLERGRIIDSFGQFTQWTPIGDPSTGRSALAAPSMRGPAGDPVIRPRSAQPARLGFRWLSAQYDEVEANDHPASTPLCGWLVPNDADHNVMVYDAGGELLGLVTDDATWQPAPGNLAAPAGPAEIANEHLAKVVDWIVSRSEDSFVQRFLDTVDSSLRMIEPNNHQSFSSRALLVGRPVAVTRAQVDLQLFGPPTVDASPSALHRRINGHPPSDHGFADIDFPVRIGEHGQFNDGLIGYFVDRDQARHEILYAPQASTSAAHSKHIQVYGTTTNAPLNVTTSFGGDPVKLTMLSDPRCPVHATSGILPTKSIHLPRDYFESSMNNLKVLVSAMPVLTDPAGVDLPLPDDPDNTWSWIALQDGAWTVTPSSPQLRYDTLAQNYPGTVAVAANGSTNQRPAAELLWEQLIDDGWLKPSGHKGLCDLAGPLPTTLGHLDAPGVAAVSRLLTKISHRVTPAVTTAAFTDRSVAREGWLQLTPRPEMTADPLPTPPPPIEVQPPNQPTSG